MFPYDDQENPDFSQLFQGGVPGFDMSGASGGSALDFNGSPSNDNGPGGSVYAPTGNDFLDLVGQARNSPALSRPDTPLYDPNDESLKRYKSLAGSTPKSEDIIQSYLNSMPNRGDYNPSTGKKIAAFLLDSIANIHSPGNAGKEMESFLTTPYNQALADWKNQGTSVQNEARLSDAARNRELQSLAFDVKQKESGKKFQSLGTQFDINKTIEAAKGELSAKHQTEMDAIRRENQDRLSERDRTILDLRQQAQDTRERALDDRENGVVGGSKKLLDPTELNVHHQAALLGIPDQDSSGHKATIGDLANEIALKELHQNPDFQDAFTPDPNDPSKFTVANPMMRTKLDMLRRLRIKQLLGMGE